MPFIPALRLRVLITILPLVILLLPGNIVYAIPADSLAKNNTEATFGLGFTLAQVQDFNQATIVEPRPGPRVAVGFNYLFNKKNKPFFLSIGGRIAYSRFFTYEESDKYVFSIGYQYLRKYSFQNTLFCAGIPMRLNYAHAITRKRAVLGGIGLYPCFRTATAAGNYSLLSIYADAYAGINLNRSLALTLEATRSIPTYPNIDHVRAEYNIWGFSVEMRYCINPIREEPGKL